MKYYYGICTSYDNIRDTLINCCVDAGWTYNSENQYLSKNNIIVRLIRQTTGYWRFGIFGRTSGGEESPYAVGMTDGIIAVQFNVGFRCFIFDSPIEVYFIIVDNTNKAYQYIAFGESNIQFTTGTGTWISGTTSKVSSEARYIAIRSTIATAFGSGWFDDTPVGPFFSSSFSNSYIHVNTGWSIDPIGIAHKMPFFFSQPNEFDKNALLIPVEANGGYWLTTSFSKLLNNRYINDETILTVGNQKWMVFPLFKKNLDLFSQSVTPYDRLDSECFAWAIRRMDLET